MKTLLTLALTAALVLAAHAATFNVGWSPNPPLDAVTGYKVYSLIGTNRTQQASVAGTVTNASVTLADGIYTLAATASNVAGESALSLPLYIVVVGTNVVAVTIVPGAPINLQLR